MKSKDFLNEKWSQKYKKSINCASPKGFSQRAHCAGRNKNEDIESGVAEDAAGVGVIASKKEKNDPRYSMSLTKDVRPGEDKKNMKKLHLEGYGRNRGYSHGFASPTAPGLGRRGREDDEYHVPDPVDTATWYIRANGKIIKDKMGTPFQFRDKEAARKAAMTMMAKPFNAGKKFVLTTKPEDDSSLAEGFDKNAYDQEDYFVVRQQSQRDQENNTPSKFWDQVSRHDSLGDTQQTIEKLRQQNPNAKYSYTMHRRTQGVAETALNPKDPQGDYDAKRKVIHDLSLDPNVDQKAVQQRRLDLDREAKAKGLKEQGVAEGMFGIDPAIKGKIQNITMDLSDIPGYWDHEQQTFTDMGLAKLKATLKKPEYVKYALNLTSDDYDADLREADAELAEPPERPRKQATKTKSKPYIKFDIPFQQAQDQPLARTDPLDDLKKQAGVGGDKPRVDIRKASQKRTLDKTAGISSPEMGDMLSRLRNIEVSPDLEPYDIEPPEDLPSVEVNTKNLPAVAGQAIQAAGMQNPEFHQVANLPGNMADQIRQLGKSLFGSLTMTPTKRIHVVANLGGQGPNTNQEVQAVAGFLKKEGKDLGPGNVDFDNVMPGYKADTHMFSAAGIRWMLVKDFAGQYIYCWPEADSHDAVDAIGYDQDVKKLR